MSMLLVCPTQSDQSLCGSLECSMSVKLLAEHHLVFLRLRGGYAGSSESTLVKLLHCWISHATAQLLLDNVISIIIIVFKCFTFLTTNEHMAPRTQVNLRKQNNNSKLAK